MEALIAFVAGAASVVAAALLAPQVKKIDLSKLMKVDLSRLKKVDLSKAVAPARQVLVGVIAATYRTGDAVADATAGTRKGLSKLVDEGRASARTAERRVRARTADHRVARPAARKAH